MAEYQRLDELCHINMGQSPDSKSYNHEGIGLPFFQGNSDFGIVYPEARVWCNTPTKIVEPGTLLISVRAPIGALNFAKEKSCIGRGLAGITSQNGVNLKYIYYCLKGKNKELNAKGTGSTFKAIAKCALGETLVKVVSEEDQQKIVQILDRVSSIIESRKQQISELDNLIKARFIELFGGTPDKEKVTMADICKIITDGTHQPPKFVSEGIPFLFVSNIVTNEIRYDAQKYISEETYAELIKRTPIAVGDILLSTVGSYGHPAVVKTKKPFCFQRHIAYLKPNADMVDSEYLRGAILSADVQRQIDEGVKGIAQKTLNLSEIRKIKLPLPPIEQQKQFAAFVEQTDKSKVVVQKALDEAQTLFDSLMQQYFG